MEIVDPSTMILEVETINRENDLDKIEVNIDLEQNMFDDKSRNKEVYINKIL